MSTETPTPRVDAMCELLGEPPSGFVWAKDARKLERETYELEKGRATFRRSLWDLVEDLKFCAWQATTDGEKFAFESSAEKLRAILNEGSK